MFFLFDGSAEGLVPTVAEGGVESRLRSAGVRRQHRHCPSLRPDGQRTLRHPAGSHLHLILSSLIMSSLALSQLIVLF